MTYKIIDVALFNLYLDKLKILANYANASGNSYLSRCLEQLNAEMNEIVEEK